MRRWLWIICAASLLVFSSAAGAADFGTATENNKGQIPPVAQTLVREGDFSIKLAAVLDLGTPSTEEEAEDLLVSAGVVPLNGWLSDYPVTPEIIGQLQESVSRAASQGTVPMTSDQAVKGLYAIAAQFNLPTPAGGDQATSNAPAGPQAQEDQQNLDTYYSDTGPPIVTYYPPPPDYLYLYDWVPYPVWWFGFWFPGFYISTSFSTVVVYHSVPVRVSNHIIDRDTGVAATVDSDWHRGHRGGRPETILQTEEGERYRTFADMQRGAPVTGGLQLEGGRRIQGPAMRGPMHQWSPEARKSARAIYSRSAPAPTTGEYRYERGPGQRNGYRVNQPWESETSGRSPAMHRYEGERNLSVGPPRYSSLPGIQENGNRPYRKPLGPGKVFGGSEQAFPAAGSIGGREDRGTGAWSRGEEGRHGRENGNDGFTSGCRGRC
jgi:hypothetical protein